MLDTPIMLDTPMLVSMDMAFMDMDFHLPFPLLLKKPQQLKLRPERSVMPMLKLTLRLTPGILPMDIMDTPTHMAPMLDMLDILMLESMDTPMPDIPMLLPSLLLLLLRSQL